MKFTTVCILIFITRWCSAQPTGHQRIFFEILDNGTAIHFEEAIESSWDNERILHKHEYKLIDVSENQTGFEYYHSTGYIHKTLMTDDHHIQLVKNKKDTMDIEILNAFNVYFLKIDFQKGKFRMYVNDDLEHQWNYSMLPYKTIPSMDHVYDITPPNWSAFRVQPFKKKNAYFISSEFEKQKLLATPIIPEEDPNFQNPRRVNHLKLEVADYNFDGRRDYREQKLQDPASWNYFLNTNDVDGFVLDTLLSSLDTCSFDFAGQTFFGHKTTQLDALTTRTTHYEFSNGELILVRQTDCVHAFRYSKKMDCTVMELENGVLVVKEIIRSCE